MEVSAFFGQLHGLDVEHDRLAPDLLQRFGLRGSKNQNEDSSESLPLSFYLFYSSAHT